eukprot:1537619-Prymnesium_polylepis.1
MQQTARAPCRPPAAAAAAVAAGPQAAPPACPAPRTLSRAATPRRQCCRCRPPPAHALRAPATRRCHAPLPAATAPPASPRRLPA